MERRKARAVLKVETVDVAMVQGPLDLQVLLEGVRLEGAFAGALQHFESFAAMAPQRAGQGAPKEKKESKLNLGPQMVARARSD